MIIRKRIKFQRAGKHPDTPDMYSQAEELRIDCLRSRWTGAPKTCQWCNVALVKHHGERRRTWCSDRCFETFQRHHVWSHAKAAALAVAKHHCEIPGCRALPVDILVLHTVPLGPERYGMSCKHHAEKLIVICKQHAREYANRVHR